MKKYDVTIVGAGLAGATVAKILSKKDLNVLLVEQFKIGDSFGSKIDVTEVKTLEQYVKKLEIKPHCITFTSKWYSPSNNLFLLELKNPDCYFFKRGPAEDSIESQLIREATKNGVELALDTKVTNIKKERSDATVILATPTGEKRIRSKVIIGADGVDSKVAKICGLSENKTIRMVEGYGIECSHFKNVEPKIPEIYINSEYAPGGYLYLAPTLDGTTTAVCLLDKRRLNNINIEKYFYSFIKNNVMLKEKFSEVKVLNKIHGVGIISGPLKTTVKNNVVLIGNAARVMDPFFAYGVKYAIITGSLAANVVVEAISENDISVLKKYEILWRNELVDSIKTGFFLRGIFDHLTDSDIEYIINILNRIKSNGLDFDEMFDSFSIKKHVLSILRTALINPNSMLKLTSLSFESLLKNKFIEI
ncbi:MAG: NAD(P)/FAD-dependent oxidoreductase [Euryarchaeota archaeon]|nr:NAD(P)/FAD-dependent oxidoreductase [Euryarchaeota archaeon]